MRSSSPPFPPQLAPPSSYVDHSPPVGLDGLRALLDEWKERPTDTKENTKDQAITKGQRDAAMKSVYSQYQTAAIEEDKDTIARWNEVLNSLLVFAGLMSAVITAFLLASQADLAPPPNETTDQLLSQIVDLLGNTTAPFDFMEDGYGDSYFIPPFSLIFWHASLGCSLMSAFGSLLSKQWILHFQSSPLWVNTMEDRCRLREIRVYGISKWRMRTIIESLPILLQLSVFLFYLGLQEDLGTLSILWGISLLVVTIIACIYAFTLVAGAFSASCPFKSPITNSRGAVVAIVTLVLFLSTYSVLPFFGYGLLYYIAIGWYRETMILVFVAAGVLIWLICISRTHLSSHPIVGEREMAQGPYSTSGVILWWLMRNHPSNGDLGAEIQVVADIIQAMPADALLRVVTWRGEFGGWCSRVFKTINSNWPPRTALRRADIVCYLVHQSEELTRAIRCALTEYSPGHPRTPELFGYVCNALRNGWTPNPVLESTPMPVLAVQPTTFAVYLRYQLLDWIYSEEFRRRSFLELILNKLPAIFQPRWIIVKGSNRRLNCNLLLQELPFALQPHYFSSSGQFHDSIADAASLSAIALVPDDTLPYLKPVKGLVGSKQLERLLQAVHRLSYYPTDQVPSKLVSVVVAATTRVVRSVKESKELYECSSWKSGEFGESLYRLLHLGRVWWHTETGASNTSPGASLVQEVHWLMYVVIRYAILDGHARDAKPKFLSPATIREVLDTYAHPSGPGSVSPEHSTKATELLHALLELQRSPSNTPLSSRFLRPWTISAEPPFTLNFNPVEHPHFIRQLIHNLCITSVDSRLKLASLSAVVKGQDIFLPGMIRRQFPRVASDIEDLSEKVLHTDSLSTATPWQPYETFNGWNELVGALEELERTVVPVRSRPQIIRRGLRRRSNTSTAYP